MKIPIFALLGFCLATSLQAQGPGDNPPATRRSPEELAELLGPVALYPDALIALILPASTYPSDIVLGARYVATDANPANIEDKPWDPSVKALTRYPDTLKWLDENLEWTTQLGDAFIDQPVEVMESIQLLRGKARDLGNLVDTPQQRIVQDDTYIRIVPSRPDYIYEPRYDPDVIYYDRPVAGPLLFFGAGLGVGSWLNYDWDWHHHRLYRGDWHQGWDYNRDRNRRDREDYYYINNNLTNSREWHPDSARHHSQSRHVSSERASNGSSAQARTQSRDLSTSDPREHHKGVARPKPLVGSPHRGETVTRSENRDGGKNGNQPVARMDHEKKAGDGPKGHVATPKSVAPGITGDGKRGNNTRDQGDHKKKGDDPAEPGRRADSPPRKEADVKGRADTPPSKHDSNKPDEPRHKIAPKHEDAPKQPDKAKRDEPKHKDAPKQQDMVKRDEPKHKDAPKQQDNAKRDEPKHKDAPKHVEPAKREAPKHDEAKPEASKGKGKKGDKKKDDDKDGKK